MEAMIKNVAFILCPQCGQSRHEVEHLFERPDWSHRFGPWHCDKCDYLFWGEGTEDRRVEITRCERSPDTKMLCLLRLRDLLVVVEKYSKHAGQDDDGFDFLFHSHQCPTNIMHEAEEVFDEDGRDPHGIFRFIAAIEDTEENRKKLEALGSREDLLKLFNTDGTEAPTNWPAEDKGVLPFIAEGRRQYRERERRVEAGKDITVRPVEGDFVVDSLPRSFLSAENEHTDAWKRMREILPQRESASPVVDHPYLVEPVELSPEARERLRLLAEQLLASGKDHIDVNGPPVLCKDCDKCDGCKEEE